ncbi:hypothetical protein [Bdellovibrio sp. HCB274]|uniref:hypothetical protein n=1 Tax=Bdellovibrio sp. HCB274 TaxID=3394361 RepID=UPI0039B53453
MNRTLEVLKRYLQHWDPIGVVPGMIIEGLDPSEYDVYADSLHTVLADGGTVEDVYTYLLNCRSHMGLKPDRDADIRLANSLHTYFKQASGIKK